MEIDEALALMVNASLGSPARFDEGRVRIAKLVLRTPQELDALELLLNTDMNDDRNMPGITRMNTYCSALDHLLKSWYGSEGLAERRLHEIEYVRAYFTAFILDIYYPLMQDLHIRKTLRERTKPQQATLFRIVRNGPLLNT